MKETPVPAPVSNRQALNRKIITWSVFICLLAVISFCFMMLYAVGTTATRHSEKVCQAHLQVIHLSAMVWAHERQTNQMPADFFAFSRELSTPGILHCLADRSHPGFSTWSDVTASNISYLLVRGVPTYSSNAFVRCPYHHLAITGEGVIVRENEDVKRF